MSLLGMLGSFKDNMSKQIKMLANDELRIGTMVAFAMITQANGKVKPEEVDTITKLIQRDQDLNVYGIDKCISDFRSALDAYEISEYLGETECIGKLEKLRNKLNDQQKKILVAKVCAIGAADGDFDKNEKEVAGKICRTLGVRESDFGI